MGKLRNMEQSKISTKKARLEESTLKFESGWKYRRAERLQFERNVLDYRVRVYGEPSILPLSLHLCRAEARKLSSSRNEKVSSCLVAYLLNEN